MSNAATITLAKIQSRPAPRALTYSYRLPGRQGYEIVDLGTFNDPITGSAFAEDSSVIPSAINTAGLVVGAEFLPTPGAVFAFSFTQAAGIVDLGLTEGAGPNNLATGVNEAGQIAFMVDYSNGGGGYMPGRLAGGTLTVLPIFGTPGYNQVTDAPTASYYTAAINGAGDVVGQAFSGPGLPAGGPASQPLLIDSGGIQGLGNLGGLGGGAKSINGAGEIVGYSQTPTTPTNAYWNPGHAFVYTKAKGLVDLNSMIVGSGGSWELLQANHINARGEIVGFGTFTGGNPKTPALRAFLFAYGVVLDLGTFPNGGISVATSINNRGEIVGYAYLDASGEGNYRACAFWPGLGPMNLNDLIDPQLGWVLAQATAVNDVGQIVGWGFRQGTPGTRGFLMTPTR